ncbi:MAG TPA: Gfo/Idh/MocA family oxidoreductase, partial [Armatimonadota bacterium]|nr:Gfo/Idh/MocA family oxidoreductase [Armatimonadota bacterium]
PGPVHASQSARALERGLHVITETPCVYSLEEAATVVDAVRRSGLKYMLAEDYLYAGFMQRLRPIVEAGELGDIVAAQGEYTHDCRDILLLDGDGAYVPWAEREGRNDTRPSWRATDLPPLKYCSHTLGPLLRLMGDRCVRVSGVSSGSRTFPAAGMIDYATAVMQTAGGRAVTLTNGFGVAHPFAFFLALYGTAGSIRCVHFGTPEVRIHRDGPDAGWRRLDCGWYDRPDGRNWLDVMFEEFLTSIREDTEPPIDVFAAMDFTLPGVCAHVSAEQNGIPVVVPDYREAAVLDR